MRESEPLIINLAPTGMVPTKEITPHVPISVDEILEDVARCNELGASIVHVHPRDQNGVPTHRSDHFAPIIEGIREIDPELVVCATCSGRRSSSLEQRAEVLDLKGDAKPDMASLTLGSNNFHRQASINPPDVIGALAQRMKRGHVRVGLEDNIWWDRGRTRAATNAELVARVTEVAGLAERTIASPAFVRERLHMPRSSRLASAEPV